VASSKYKYTMVAAKAVSLAELFVQSFDKGLDGPVHFKVEMSAPDGPSTSGGKQALQHIKLIPDGGGMAIVIGSADTTTAQAEVRTFDHIATLYGQRFRGAAIPIDAGKYNELSQTLSNFFRSMNMKVTFAELESSAKAIATAGPAASEPARSGVSGALIAVIGIVVAALVLGGAYALVFLKH
jgi:hypothetical protein